ncbi:MAG: hypothetical protein ABI824_04355 [Acidobacteriota bacterium]
MTTNKLGSPQARLFWVALSGVLLASRLAHRNILWADEDYHIAEAVQVLLGKVLYRDVWYDKPPLSALFLALFGAPTGWALRLLGATLAIANCAVAFRFAKRIWGAPEGFFAASLLGFFQVFYIASATIPVEPDTLMLLPHLLAVYLAWSGKPLAAGIAAGFAFLLNLKGLFVLASCLLFVPLAPVAWASLAAGFSAPVLAAAAWFGFEGALPAYLEQVWRWGLLYAGSPPNETTFAPLQRLGDWLAFHGVLVLGAGLFIARPSALRWKWLGWTALSLAATCVGWRISPHYLNQLLPPLTIAAAAGLASLRSRDHRERLPFSTSTTRIATALVLIGLLVPIIRFGPRYAILAAEDIKDKGHDWSDVQMDQDSRRAASLIHRIARKNDTIFIWGYRPNLIAYTGLPVASRFWDSQPITGVAADRHLGNATPLDPGWAKQNRAELIQTHPSIIVDGLSAYNPKLDIHSFPDLAEWLSHYCDVSTTGTGITIYKLCR